MESFVRNADPSLTYLSIYLAIPTYARARILSGCLRRNTVVVIVLEMVAIFARS